jgi:dipeptidyl aminopeptidase/acylaminoacyl peptidase
MRFRFAALGLAAAVVLGGCAKKEATQTAREVPVYSVEDFYKTVQYTGGWFSPDDSKILLSSNLSGIFNAVAVPTAGGAPVPLTNSATNSVFAAGYFPADERFLYTSDQGGNELAHLYVQNPDGTSQDLTPGANLKADFAGWAGDDASFFVISNERDQRFFDVYEYAVDGYARTMIYRNDEGYDLGAISRDKRYMAFSKSRTTADSDIFLHDRETGTTVDITEHEGSVSNQPQAFTPDGTGLLYLSDEGREFAALHRYNLADGAKTAVLEPSWDVVGAGYSKSGKYLLVTVNEDATYVSRVYDAGTMRDVSMPGLPPGLIRGMRFSRDDARYAFYSSDGSTPDDLWAGEMGKAPSRLTNALNPAINRADLVVPTVTRFTSYDGTEVPGVLYRPHAASAKNKVPALVFVHGGPGGEATVGYSALTQCAVNHGYAVFDINNRGSSGYGKTFFTMDDRKHGEADLGDVVASKGMLAATGYVDSTRIGILGGSYGGYMTLAALTLRPDAFKVGVDLFGISNWVRTLESIPPYWESFREALYAEMGDPKTDSERLHRISPLFNADKIRSPLMVLQGANDPRVLKVESDEIVAAARKNGVPVEYVVFPDEGHGFLKTENRIEGSRKILAFLDTYLKGTPPAQASAGE